jgi:protein-L-isoaspartate(D-aspartate) O-methyltransferase
MIKTTQYRQFATAIHQQFPLTEEVFNAFATLDRAYFLPSGLGHKAYALDALPIGAEQWISSPVTVAKMTTYLKLDDHVDSVLEIGCGSGYQAAILSQLVRRVFSIERIESLLNEAKERFRLLDIHNINTRLADGQLGWSQFAPFDRILFSATATKVPMEIFAQLKDGGILVMPMLEEGREVIMRFTKNGKKLRRERLGECAFVPVLDGVQK